MLYSLTKAPLFESESLVVVRVKRYLLQKSSQYVMCRRSRFNPLFTPTF